jgi:hypothetical protein
MDLGSDQRHLYLNKALQLPPQDGPFLQKQELHRERNCFIFASTSNRRPVMSSKEGVSRTDFMVYPSQVVFYHS